MGVIVSFQDWMGKRMPRTDIDTVAKFFLSKNDPYMTHKKLQKLCYYAYSWFLTLHDQFLFTNRFEAWIHGPVDPILYQDYKVYGWRTIPGVDQVPELEDDIHEFLEDLYESYGEFKGGELEYLTHQEEPWIEARGGLSATQSSNERIKDVVIKQYYQRVYEEGQND